MTLTVYGASLSPFVRKVRVFLAEKGEAYKLEQVNIFPPPDWFLEISPLKRIPVLRDENEGAEATLPDSSAICGYLEKKFPAPALYPADAFAFGKALWYEEYADSDLAGNVGMGTFRPMVVNRMMGREADRETAEKTMAEKLPRNFDYFEKEIGSKTYLVADSFSIADISLATHFVNLAHAGFRPDEKTWPNLTRYLAGILARPSFAACIEEETALLGKFGL
ncbi:glutathione S-transferase family protein [Parvibaculum sp.]|jgi:glutathione S-transferase|uniref:glutathione S-transferase family protein n=1 Tax=Parvibaculum sp. TaxID=2024848 RepID=UPI000C467F96|nr:glutathione S-transferase family protein [Parvibaculum sp.]MAU61931.1 glutathione S-transferase [Parvibaculum sp.]MBO6666823.1 glutathione S-transferase family protein [Parvibaculum sp.]MBO6691659.1 glutathione S-transferase family protein [Parvibaculum sp.]MBO6713444.1 glutathione S-transferase family protein [Parvibaculum sp.]|tara:strand:+ start:1693 stop:2358 length:666 start_codon:yes stop_codon:yes gene_type:complete